jgi:hypothetical protein
VSGDGNLEKFYDLTPFAEQILEGTNSIAVQLSNAWEAGWDNVAFDVSLRAISDETPAAASLTAVALASNSLRLTLRADAASRWRLEAASSVSAAAWDALAEVAFTGPETRVVEVTRVAGSAKFYRLVRLND